MTGTPTARAGLAGLCLLVGALLTGCGGPSPASACTSEYRPVATADSWPALRSALLSTRDFGRVAAVTTVDRGLASTARRIERVVVLLDAKEQTAAQLDVWRTADGGWRAGVWMQCTDHRP